jgi:hypothetical protein
LSGTRSPTTCTMSVRARTSSMTASGMTGMAGNGKTGPFYQNRARRATVAGRGAVWYSRRP